MTTVDYIRLDGKTVSVTGVDFVNQAVLSDLGRGPLVSPEWTFQLVNAYQRLADDYRELGDAEKAKRYANRQQALREGLMAMAEPKGNTTGFAYASLANAPIGHEYNTPAKGSLSSIGVAYGILAWTGYDPLRLPDEALPCK